ncbi:hypothetical protein GOBAR_DD00253 [Gossypium barbadense]|nr:hypothetical protein GOBAR_DD00253 [Gossypium barbadense]
MAACINVSDDDATVSISMLEHRTKAPTIIYPRLVWVALFGSRRWKVGERVERISGIPAIPRAKIGGIYRSYRRGRGEAHHFRVERDMTCSLVAVHQYEDEDEAEFSTPSFF